MLLVLMAMRDGRTAEDMVDHVQAVVRSTYRDIAAELARKAI